MQSQVGGEFKHMLPTFYLILKERNHSLKKLFRGVHIKYTRVLLSLVIANAPYELLKKNVFLSSAGFDTTHKKIRWLVLYMAAYPAVQGCVQELIDSVVGQNRPPVLADKPRLVYTEAVIQEVMRIVTMVPLSIPDAH
ncbi:CP2J6-like protein [Mya arenaria]|uniref:CP2J6-like protein n=1 Tax=Mya arenaria TaxID=6604 RepID=A0ABY7DPF5_MYAAR|nr:CP2J6-like protein [Mya arenaria]